jgi:hypothetical protein
VATYIEINGNKYPASITGRLNDKDWNNRESKAIEIEMSYADAISLFVDDVAWNIIQENEIQREVIDEEENITFETVIEEEVYDNSDYCIAGDIVDHRNGKVTIKMGKPTAEELLALLEEVM